MHHDPGTTKGSQAGGAVQAEPTASAMPGVGLAQGQEAAPPVTDTSLKSVDEQMLKSTEATQTSVLSSVTSDSGPIGDSKPSISKSEPSASNPPQASSTEAIHGVKKGSVLMLTGSTGTSKFLGIPHLKEMVYENRMSYAMRHGYEMMWANFTTYNLTSDAPMYWNKIPILQEAFLRYPEVEWLWWMDLDMIIMNHSLSMWDHLLSREGMARNVVLDEVLKQPGGHDSAWHTPASYNYDDVNFIISSGGWGMNIGNFLIRRSQWANWLLDLWVEPLYIGQKWTFPENDGWTHMYRHHPIVRQHTICTNQRALNAYPQYNSLGEHWHEGDHTIHFAGCGGWSGCEGAWHKYWDKRELYDVPATMRKQLEDGTAKIENVQKGIGLPS
jgi:galactosyl transferase GMA12/MNN10 family